jgi:S1-C subfamily serine protease
MRSAQGAIRRVIVLTLLFSLSSISQGFVQTSPRKETGSCNAGTASKQTVLPDFVMLVEKLGPVVVNISMTQIIKEAPAPFEREDPLAEF